MVIVWGICLSLMFDVFSCVVCIMLGFMKFLVVGGVGYIGLYMVW